MLRGECLELLPDRTIGEMYSHFNDARNFIRELRSESSINNPDFVRSKIEGLKRSIPYFQQYKMWLPYFRLRQLETLDEELAAARKKYLVEAEQIASKVGEADRLIAGVSVAAFQTDFGRAAEAHRKSSVTWLCFAAGLFLLAIVAAFFFFDPFNLLAHSSPASEPPISVTVRSIAARIVLLTFLFYGALWTGRMYRASRHLYVVNHHRALALMTFDKFAGAAKDDPPTKNAILLAATNCIFGPSPSGYLSAEEDVTPKAIVEVVKTAGGEAGKV